MEIIELHKWQYNFYFLKWVWYLILTQNSNSHILFQTTFTNEFSLILKLTEIQPPNNDWKHKILSNHQVRLQCYIIKYLLVLFKTRKKLPLLVNFRGRGIFSMEKNYSNQISLKKIEIFEFDVENRMFLYRYFYVLYAMQVSWMNWTIFSY